MAKKNKKSKYARKQTAAAGSRGASVNMNELAADHRRGIINFYRDHGMFPEGGKLLFEGSFADLRDFTGPSHWNDRLVEGNLPSLDTALQALVPKKSAPEDYVSAFASLKWLANEIKAEAKALEAGETISFVDPATGCRVRYEAAWYPRLDLLAASLDKKVEELTEADIKSAAKLRRKDVPQAEGDKPGTQAFRLKGQLEQLAKAQRWAEQQKQRAAARQQVPNRRRTATNGDEMARFRQMDRVTAHREWLDAKASLDGKSGKERREIEKKIAALARAAGARKVKVSI